MTKHQFSYDFMPNNAKILHFLMTFSKKSYFFMFSEHTITFLPIYYCSLLLQHKHISHTLRKRDNTKTKNNLLVNWSLMENPLIRWYK